MLEHAVPAIHHVEMNVELVDDAHRNMIDHVVKTLRMIIKRRHWREDHDSHARQFQHVLEMDLVKWRLANDEHQFTTFFENDVGGAMNQVVTESVRDRGERSHTAWSDDHSECHKRTAGDRRALIAA